MLSDPSSVIRNLKMELGIRRRRREHIDSTTGSHVDTNFQSNLESALKTFASSFGDLILDVVKHKSRPYWRKIKRDDVCGTCRLLSSWITDSPQGVTTLPICERCCVEVFERSVKFNNHCPLYVYFVLRYSDPISLLDKVRCMASQVQFHTFTESSLNGESAISVIGRITRRW